MAQLTFDSWDDAARDVPDNDEDLRIKLKRKAWRVKKFSSDPGRVRAACTALFTVLPLDHLWRTVQAREEAGNCLQDLVVGRSNVFEEALLSYARLLSAPVSQGCMSALVRHWAPDASASTYLCYISTIRRESMQRAGHSWVRLHCRFNDFPFRFLVFVDPRCARQERLAVAEEFFAMHVGCLDKPFSLKVSSLLIEGSRIPAAAEFHILARLLFQC